MRRAGQLATCILTASLVGCAAGVARVNADGSCEVRGYAIGRSEIAAYYPVASSSWTQKHDETSPAKSQLCARMHGGTGSSDFWDTVSAGVGAIVGWLAAP